MCVCVCVYEKSTRPANGNHKFILMDEISEHPDIPAPHS